MRFFITNANGIAEDLKKYYNLDAIAHSKRYDFVDYAIIEINNLEDIIKLIDDKWGDSIISHNNKDEEMNYPDSIIMNDSGEEILDYWIIRIYDSYIE